MGVERGKRGQICETWNVKGKKTSFGNDIMSFFGLF